jgi:hypothetical protein
MPSDESRDSNDDAAVKPSSERPKEGERKKKIKRPKPPLPRTEREIDAPDRLTLLMLGVMCVMTLVLWAFARGGCNYHPPRETRRPRPIKTEELARDPKDAALEMQQRLVQYDFDGALELATDSAGMAVATQKVACATKAKECAENKKKNEHTATTAVLLERDMGSATVRATSTTAPPRVNILKVERRGPVWKVVSYSPDDGSYKPKPAPTMELIPGSTPLAPSPGMSGTIDMTPPPGPSARPRVSKLPPKSPAPAMSAKP